MSSAELDAGLSANDLKLRDKEMKRFFAPKPLRADEAKLLHKFEVSFKDNKGVSKDELLDMIMEAGCAEFIACKWVKALYSKYDRKKTGSVLKEQVIQAYKRKPPRKIEPTTYRNYGIDLSRLRVNFEIVDRNRDGLLNRKEMRGLLTLLNEDPIIIPQMINDFFALFGKSEKDATCDFEHFYANYARMLMFRAIFELKNKAGWELEDCNKDGYISMDELETMLQKWVGVKAAEEFTGKCFRDISGHSEKQLSKSDIEEKQKEGYVRHEELFKWYYKEFNQTAIHAVVAGRLKQL